MIVNAKVGDATHKIEWKASNARVGVKNFRAKRASIE